MSSINGKSKKNACNVISHIAGHFTKGIFRDDYWHPIHQIFDAINQYKIICKIETTRYVNKEDGKPHYKEWILVFPFENNRGSQCELHGRLIASFCGSVDDPMSAYDLVFTIS